MRTHQALLQPCTEVPVLARCPLPRRSCLQSLVTSADPIRLATEPSRTVTAARIMYYYPARPFYILLSHFSNRQIHIPMPQHVTFATSLDLTLIHIIPDEVPASIAEQTRIEHIIAPIQEDDNDDWWHSIRIGETFESGRDTILTILE